MFLPKNTFNPKLKKFLTSFIIFSLITNSVYTITTTGTFSQVIEGFDWGPCVTKMIIKLDTTIQYTSSGIDSSSFSVTTTKEGLSKSEQRTINKAYVSEEKGNS